RASPTWRRVRRGRGASVPALRERHGADAPRAVSGALDEVHLVLAHRGGSEVLLGLVDRPRRVALERFDGEGLLGADLDPGPTAFGGDEALGRARQLDHPTRRPVAG